MAETMLVSSQEMEATITKYNQAHTDMDQAFQAMDKAWDHLCNVWDGTVRTAFMAEWVTIMGNIRKSDLAMQKAINGLVTANNLFIQNEETLSSKAESLDAGTVPPMF